MGECEQDVIEHLIEECVNTAQDALMTMLVALRLPLPASQFVKLSEAQTLSQELLHNLELANQAGSDDNTTLAEEGYHRAINLMVEVRSRTAAGAMAGRSEAASA